MANRAPDTDSDERTNAYPGTPRWVRGLGIGAVIVLLLVAFIIASGLGGQHGPQRHGAAGERPGQLDVSVSRPITVA